MPFWPWYMLACVGLMIYGRKVGAVFAPAAILCGLLAMRAVVTLPPDARELAAFIPWLCVAMALMYKGEWVPGMLCLLSGAVYPTMLVAGLHIDYLGIVAIIADILLIAALVATGVGMAQRFDPGHSRARMVGNGEVTALGMAENQVCCVEANRGGS